MELPYAYAGMSRRAFIWLSGLSIFESILGRSLAAQPSSAAPTGRFETLGMPVRIGRLHGTRVGPDDQGRRRWVYFAFAQAQGNPPFLLVVQPDTGEMQQVFPPQEKKVVGFKSLYPGTDGCVYIGSYNPARLLRFDPRHPERRLQDIGGLPRASMVWWLQEATDGRLYMTTSAASDGARLFSWDPKTDKIRGHGQLSTENKYATYLLASADGGTLYAVVAPEKYDVVAYDVRTGLRRGLLTEAQRGTGFIGIDRGEDSFLHATLPERQSVLVEKVTVNPGPPWHELEDGRRVIATAESLTVTDIGGKQRTIPLRYEAGTEVFTLHPGPDGKVYAFTHAPLRLCVYDPQTETLTALGNPFATADGHLGAAANWQGRIVLVAYPGCDLALYDPVKPWHKGPTPQDNPWTWGKPQGEGHKRPAAMVVGSDGLLYVGSDLSHGVPGGAVACLRPQTGETVYNLREPFLRRQVYALAADPQEPVIYIGCVGIEPSGDGKIKGAHVLAWDIRERRVLWDVVPVGEARYISSLNYVAERLCGTTLHDYAIQHFFALDPHTGKSLHVVQTPVAGVVHGNVRLGPDGWLYGLTYVQHTLFRIHPGTYVVQEIAKPPQVPKGYALAVTREGLYFGAGAALMRFRFEKPLRG